MAGFVPLYHQIKERIRQEHLSAPEAREGTPLPTERDLQIHYGVSRPTISKALTALAAEGLVVKAQGRGCFVRRPTPGNGTADSSRRIGFVASIASAELVQRAFRGIRRVAHRRGYRVIVSDGSTLDAERQAVLDLVQSGVRGLVMYPAVRHLGDRGADYLADGPLPVPTVLIDTGLPVHPFPQVVFDNRRLGFDITHYLLGRGCRRIALLSWPADLDHLPLAERFRGYVDALADHGVPVRDEFIARWDPTSSVNELPRVLARWFDLASPPDAIVAPEDTGAIEVITELQARGIRVPQDVRVVGFDNRIEARHFRPAFTTTSPDFERMGEIATGALLDALEAGVPAVDRTWVLPVPLYVRRASGSPGTVEPARARAHEPSFETSAVVAGGGGT